MAQKPTAKHSLATDPQLAQLLQSYEGGLRAMQVIPIDRGAVHDSPTLGGFLGARIGTLTAGISPELGIFYDHSALHLHKGNVLFVPAITVHGDVARWLRP